MCVYGEAYILRIKKIELLLLLKNVPYIRYKFLLKIKMYRIYGT